MGESKWKSADALFKEKRGKRRKFTDNFKTRQGKRLEPVTRSHSEAHVKVLTPAATVVSITRPCKADSLDEHSGKHGCGEVFWDRLDNPF